MLFTNKMLFKNRLFPTQKVQNFQLCTLIMLFDRLPQVSCQYESSLNKALEEKNFLDAQNTKISSRSLISLVIIYEIFKIQFF